MALVSAQPLAVSDLGGKVLHVVAAAVISQGRVLVARRLPGGRHGGLWEFPGGKVEEGEDAHDALARELAEELGVVARAVAPLTQVRWSYPERTILLDVHLCEIIEGEPQPRECAETAWVTVEELMALPMPEADADVVVAIRKVVEQGLY